MGLRTPPWDNSSVRTSGTLWAGRRNPGFDEIIAAQRQIDREKWN